MTNRRSLLSCLSTAALALLAPVATFARPRFKKAPDLTPEQIAEFKRLWKSEMRRAEIAEAQFKSADCRAKYHRQMATGWRAAAESHPDIALADRHRDACVENASLRALLAEARETIRHDPFHDSEHLIARIDAAIDRTQT